MSAPLTGELRTWKTLAQDLQALGLSAGDTVLTHSSLRSIGWVCGGAEAVVQALLDVLGPTGTLVVPTQTGENSDPSGWCNPPVPNSWWPQIRKYMPAYDPKISRSRSMGVIPETVRTWPGAHRSAHPHTSFAALGRLAAQITSEHPLDCQLGERSPLGKLEEIGAKVLLLGVGYDTCTTFHLGEYRQPVVSPVEHGCAMLVDGHRQWVTYQDLEVDADDFGLLGKAFEATSPIAVGQIGEAESRLFGVREAVTFATTWLSHHRR